MRGFSFEQLAVILLVVLGLVVIVILFISQVGKVSSGLSGVNEQVSGSTSSINSCTITLGQCVTSCATGYSQDTNDNSCPPGKICCKRS